MYYKRKMSKVGIRGMKPRIFVSSTFYDLKYIREDLSNFIKAHDFDPILFEDGDIGYTPGKSLDGSCYETMKSSDIVLLIIGGLYGSPATGEVKQEFKEYMSVTRSEFRSAINEGIPVFAFIDAKVYSEYAVYEANINEIETKKMSIKFSVTKDINIFRFIKEIKNIGNISITEFSKLADIKDFLSKQWADMFKKYLEILKENKVDSKVKDTVSEMNLLVQKMNLMLDSVGKKILSADNSDEYKNVLERQGIIEVCKKIADGIGIENISRMDTEEKRKEVIRKFLDVIKESLNTDIWDKLATFEKEQIKEFFGYFSDNNVALSNISVDMVKDVKDIEKMLGDTKKTEMLINELIKDDYYEKIGNGRDKEEYE